MEVDRVRFSAIGSWKRDMQRPRSLAAIARAGPIDERRAIAVPARETCPYNVATSLRDQAISMQNIVVPISPGELIDKITILQIKSDRMTDPTKVANVRTELGLLQSTWQSSPHAAHDIQREWAELRRINESLWDIEDKIRDKERDQQFDKEFIELARAVYVTNDERAAVKRAINTKLGSTIVEEKSYSPYRR
jgi:hypothetical protein